MRASVLISKHTGEGEPLVLLHGIGTTRHDFMQVHGQLTADCAGAADGTALPLQRPAVPQNPPRKGVSSARKPSRLAALRGRCDD
jgi:predicted esterase